MMILYDPLVVSVHAMMPEFARRECQGRTVWHSSCLSCRSHVDLCLRQTRTEVFEMETYLPAAAFRGELHCRANAFPPEVLLPTQIFASLLSMLRLTQTTAPPL